MTAKLLLVEDSRCLRMAARQVLSHAGFIVVEASDGEEALRKARKSEPDLIILDMLLPKLGGERVLQALQQDPTTARIPVIVLSGLSQGNAEEELIPLLLFAYVHLNTAFVRPRCLVNRA